MAFGCRNGRGHEARHSRLSCLFLNYAGWEAYESTWDSNGCEQGQQFRSINAERRAETLLHLDKKEAGDLRHYCIWIQKSGDTTSGLLA